MNYPTHDTDWDESQKGNQWRRLNGIPLVVGKVKNSKLYWASVDDEFLKDYFKTLEEAQFAAEREFERREKEWAPPY